MYYNAAVVSHTEEGFQNLITSFANACKEFGLTISVKKTEVMGQNTTNPPIITIGEKVLEVADQFTYLGSTISSNMSLDREFDKRIGKASGTMSRLNKRVWSNKLLTTNTKVRVYEMCVLSTLLYSSEAWTTYARQENRLNTFNLRCLRRILGVTWEDKITNIRILEQAKSVSIHSMLRLRRLRWLGHVSRMPHGRIPQEIMYGELASGQRSLGRPKLRYKDVCKQDLKLANIDLKFWEGLARDRDSWHATVKCFVKQNEEQWRQQREEKCQKRKARLEQPRQASAFVCPYYNRDC